MRKLYLSLIILTAALLSAYRPAAQSNVALGKTAVASTIENSNYPASLVNDGHGDGSEVNGTGACSGTCTRWASQPSDPQWIYIDLASTYNLDEVRINWEIASARDFEIQVSNDAVTWTTVQAITNNSSYINIINMTGYSGRYVRMYGTARTTTYGYSIWEFEIYGTIVTPLGTNIALGKPAVASSEQNPAVVASAAVDGEGDEDDVDYLGGCTGACTFWASDEGVDPQWIYVDLGARYNLRQAIIYWGFFNARDFQIEVSNDGVTWTPVNSVVDNTAYVNTLDLTGASGQYVRLLGTERNTIYSYIVYEFQLYGTEVILPINLSEFTAQINNKNVDVKWKASLDQSSVFEVERSSDGVRFSTVGTLNIANGTNGEFESFSFRDASPLPGKGYYRLKYTESGSAPEYSRIVSVNFSAKGSLVVYPNPVKGNVINIDLSKPYTGSADILITNSTGAVVFRQKQQVNNQQKLEVKRDRSLPAGNYLLQVTMGNETQSKIIVCL
ncbi:MAG TPA: discoidin domain-containing protein [Flavisolibacter sp.]